MVNTLDMAKGRFMETNEITTEVRPMGNGAICYVPKTWLGKRVRIKVIGRGEKE
jgi:putative transposon-encoded protein